ncbi:metal-dependent hydrolase [Sphingobium amiense]|uniref:Metal-dependent hydrolase n=1 Tax=Sphingobium amiense TaxID=135719 RepID=A0A494WAZ3_9SPHN|nr:metal-dependent hydrolase [Sphingobium amiense]BBD99857.1 metal-dependent hydrolase [Sphingobium amiense]
MDNLTHSMVGWTLGRAGLKSKTRKATAALVLGSNLPDIDVFFGWLPWASLATHRGFSHSLLGGTVILPAILAALLWLLDRWQSGRGAERLTGRMDVRWLFALSYAGAVIHSLMDLQTVYAVQLFLPLTSRWFHTETLFIIDGVILAILIAAVWLSRRGERSGGQWRRPALWGLIALAGYIGLNGAVSLAARHSVTAHLGFHPDALYARSVPFRFWERELVWRDRGRIGMATFDPLRSLSTPDAIQPLFPDRMRDPLTLRAIKGAPRLKPFLLWSTMPVAIVRKSRCEASIELGDARFMAVGAPGALPAIRPFAEPPVVVPLPTPKCRPRG